MDMVRIGLLLGLWIRDRVNDRTVRYKVCVGFSIRGLGLVIGFTVRMWVRGRVVVFAGEGSGDMS